jgi:hypothetical protein
MPRRRNREPQPKYSFINVEPKGTSVSCHKSQSSTVRRHAAYWGGPAKLPSEDEKNSFDTVAIVSDADEGEAAAARQPSSKWYRIQFRNETERRKSLHV